jgi:hypothetical protein
VCLIENPTLHLCAFFVQPFNVRPTNGVPLVLVCLFGVGAGLYIFYRGFLLLERRRLILDTPFSKNRSAEMGVDEVSAPAQKVIRLSTAPAPTLSTEMSQQQRIAAAMMKAGITSPAAWAVAGLGEAAVAVSENPNEGKSEEFEQRPPVVLTKGTNDKAFMISWRSQCEVARSLGWKCTLMIWGGAGVALIGLCVLVWMGRLS